MFNIISTAFLATLAAGTKDMFPKKKKKKRERRKKERREKERKEGKKEGRKKKERGFSRSWGFREN